MGAAIGQELERLLDAVVEGVLPNERAKLLKRAQKDWKFFPQIENTEKR